MTPSAIIAISCNVLAVIALLLLIFIRNIGIISKYRRYFVASAAVYLSGTLLITLIIFIAVKIPVMFAVMSEIMIFFVFAVVMFVLYKSASTIAELQKKAESGQMRSAEQVKAEDEAFYGKEESLEGEDQD